MNSTTERKSNYDLLRVISAFAVVLLHVNAYYFIDFAEYPAFNAQYIIGSIINIVTRFSVPCFFMISGAFNLSKEKNVNAIFFYTHALYKTFLPLVVVTVILVIKDILVDPTYVKTIFIGIMQGSYNNTWFMFVLAGLYLATPAIIRVKKASSSKEFCAIAICLLVWAMISQSTSSYHVSYTLGNVFSYMGYYLIGNIIYEKCNNDYTGREIAYKVIAIIVSIAIAFAARFMGITNYLFATHTSFFSPAIIVMSVCVFSIFAQIRIKKDFSMLGKLTFFVYLFHRAIYLPIVSMQIWEQCAYTTSVLLISVITFILSLAVSWLFNTIYSKCVNRLEVLRP